MWSDFFQNLPVKRTVLHFSNLVYSKMLLSTLLWYILLTTPVRSNTTEDSCGCTTEIVESHHRHRIPSKITEKYCQESGAPCAMHENYKVSERSEYLSIMLLLLLFYSVINYQDYWKSPTLKNSKVKNWSCSKETYKLVLVVFAHLKGPKGSTKQNLSTTYKLWKLDAKINIVETLLISVCVAHSV